MKLYRYRPLNAFLFKELLYQEAYYATSDELNDPLDLNRPVNFYTNSINDVQCLAYTYIVILLLSFTVCSAD